MAFLFTIISDYPLWLMVLPILAGLLYAGLLYGNIKKSFFSKKIRLLLTALRFIVITVLAFLLLSPLIKTFVYDVEKPIIVIAHDNSASVITHDTASWLPKYRNDLTTLINKLGDRYDVVTGSFGEKWKDTLLLSFDHKQTDIASIFDNFATRFTGRNVGAYIIATDGIYNHGINPVYQLENIAEPVYTIALGDTTLQRDIFLSEVNYNRIAYLGNDFPVEIVVRAEKCNGKKSRIAIQHGKKTLVNEKIDIDKNSFTKTFSFMLSAKESGLQEYIVSVLPVDDEVTTSNNKRNIFIDILDSKRNILFISSGQHPDIGAFKQAVLSNTHYEFEATTVKDFSGNLSAYHLVVLHQLPDGLAASQKVVQQVIENDIPRLFIIGGQTHIPSLNQFGLGFSITTTRARLQYNEVLPAVNSSFTLFQSMGGFEDITHQMPPLISPFGKYSSSGNQNTLLYQKVGNITTDMPLVAFYPDNNVRTGVIFGEGIWRWRLYAYKNTQSHNTFHRFLNSILQYLSVHEEKKRFMVYTDRYYTENEPVKFNAGLYDKSFNPLTTPDIHMAITSADNQREYTYVFTRQANNYTLNAGKLPVGKYSYKAIVKFGDAVFTETGSFIVAALDIENTITRADHALLDEMAKRTNGKMVDPGNINMIYDWLSEHEDIKPVRHAREKFTELFYLTWILVLIIIMLTVEWFIRKRAGSY